MKKGILFSLIMLLGLTSCSTKTENTTYFVTFKNYDNTVLYHTQVKPGEVVSYVGETPQKESDSTYDYVFYGWDKDVSKPITGNTIFVAQFGEENRQFHVVFLNYDGEVLYETTIESGRTVYYNGETPTRPSEVIDGYQYVYTFEGRDHSLSYITSDLVIRAVYSYTRNPV